LVGLATSVAGGFVINWELGR